MKIISWNINGYRAITGQNPSRRYDKVVKENKLFKFIDKERPDIICLQEIKASPEQIDENLRVPEGYYGYYNSCQIKKGYSGVAVFTKNKPKNVNYNFGIEKFDVEGRFLELDFEDFLLYNIYFPKGYTDDERLDYKLEFYDSFFKYCENKRKIKKNIIISGDYNTAHKEIDLARPEENINTSGFLISEREKIDYIIELGYLDSFRLFTKDSGHYTWWSQRGRARENNIGWRIDYHFVTDSFKNQVKKSYHLPFELGSDHCPIVLETK